MNVSIISKHIFEQLKGSKLFRDSFWAVFGNGAANVLFLLTGIFIARILGKDIYGEYGFVKTTMFQIAAFSTFGLGYTSTKFIAQYIVENPSQLKSITKSSLLISFVTSFILSLTLIVSAKWVAEFVGHPQLVQPFKYLGLIVITRALSTVCTGLISGYKRFYRQGVNHIISGVVMLILAPILTYKFGLTGSLVALFLSQLVLSGLHIILLYEIYKELPQSSGDYFGGRLLKFSIPVAMQELTYAITGWGIPVLIAKYANLGELGIYSVAAQWDAIILYIPSLLSSVVLSYLSTTSSNVDENNKLFNKLLIINFVCVLIPFVIIAICSSLIASMYGSTFVGLQKVINILVFSTIFTALSRVYQNDMISQGLNWQMFFFRAIRDCLVLISIYIMLRLTAGVNAAVNYSILMVICSVIYLLFLSVARYIRVYRANRSSYLHN